MKVKVSILTAGGAITSGHHRVIYDSVFSFYLSFRFVFCSFLFPNRGRMKPNLVAHDHEMDEYETPAVLACFHLRNRFGFELSLNLVIANSNILNASRPFQVKGNIWIVMRETRATGDKDLVVLKYLSLSGSKWIYSLSYSSKWTRTSDINTQSMTHSFSYKISWIIFCPITKMSQDGSRLLEDLTVQIRIIFYELLSSHVEWTFVLKSAWLEPTNPDLGLVLSLNTWTGIIFNSIVQLTL